MPHKKVQVVTILSKGQENWTLLLQLNVRRKGLWQNVTGSVDPEEDFLAAAKREFTEETGMESFHQFLALDLEYRFTDQYQRDCHEKCYLAHLQAEDFPKIILDPKEHQNYRWELNSEINPQSFGHQSNYECWKKAAQCLSF